MPISKQNISAPLEAGASILQSTQLPADLHEALDYVSSRLMRKRLHLSLIVVKKDCQIWSPAISPPTTAPSYSSLSALPRSASPTSFRNINLANPGPASPISSASCTTTFSNTSSDLSLRSASTNATSLSTSTIYLSRTRWSGLPSSPKDSVAHHIIESQQSPVSSTSSTPSPEWTQPNTPNRYGITLMHSSTLSPRAERILRDTISRAEAKFPSIGSNWLSTSSLSTPIDCPSTQDLIRRSLLQKNLVFTSEGLSLYSLDFVYTFKCALHTYSRSLSSEDLTSAVDELRRLVLIQNGRRVTRGYLVRCYEWLGISLSALIDVDEAYKNCYGGSTRQGAVEVAVEDSRSPPHLKTSFGTEVSGQKAEDLVEVGESAKGRDGQSPIWEKEIEDINAVREDRGPFLRGKRTPNEVKDCSPTTRDEWRNIMWSKKSLSLVEVEIW